MKSLFSTTILGLCFLTLSCKRQHEPQHFPIPQANAADLGVASPSGITLSVENMVLEKGQVIAAQAFGVLSSQLGKAVAQAGLTNAITFCSVHGIAITSSVGVTNQVELRRVTQQPRNPQNRADTNELALIQRFQAQLAGGVSPKPIVTTNRGGHLTCYAPIVLKLPLCLSCHGQPGADINADVMDLLKQNYPQDEATGFRMGQLRGLWRVDFKRSDFEK